MPAARHLPSQIASSLIRGGTIIEESLTIRGLRPEMRVRITKALTGSIDGIQLSRLSKGQVYDVYTSLACYLLSEEVAEPAVDDAPTAILPLEKKLFQQPVETRRGIVLPRSLAADRNRKKKKPKQPGY